MPGSGSVHGAWAPTSRDTRHAAAPGGTTDRQMGVAPDGRQHRFSTCFGSANQHPEDGTAMIMTTTPDSANAAAPKRHRSMIITSAGEDFGIDRVAEDLAMAFGGSVRREVIERVVLSARRDLDGEVPPAALAEFTHRA